jgi:hypothetical protein
MKLSLRIIGILGLAFFASLFALTYGMPGTMEESAKSFVQAQIEREIREKYRDVKASAFTEKAILVAERLGYEETRIRENIENRLPEKIAEVIASICGYDCEKKKALAESITAGYLKRIADIRLARQNLGEIIKGKYLEIVGNLRVDLRIFLGSNALMFFILSLVSLLKPKAVAHLFLPGMFLLVSTLAASAIYLFGQDWFYVILYNDYMGFAYLAYIGVIFGFLMDIAFNGARATTEVINVVLNAIGSAFTVAPC